MCLAFVAADGLQCVDANLFLTNGTLTGLTPHFTNFGVLVNNDSGDGGDNLALIVSTTVIIPLAFLATVVVVVAVSVAIFVKWRLTKGRAATGIDYTPDTDEL